MTKPPADEKRSLSEAARAKREEATTEPDDQRGDRTTLSMDDLAIQAGAAPGPDSLGESLVERGLISRHQLFNALNDSYSRGRTLREALVALGYVTEDMLKLAGF